MGERPSDIALADLNGDGRLDIAVVNRGDDGDLSTASVAVLLQKLAPINTGDFQHAAPYAIGGKGTQIAIADFDNDGFIDLAITNFNGASILYQNAQAPVTFLPPELVGGDNNGE